MYVMWGDTTQPLGRLDPHCKILAMPLCTSKFFCYAAMKSSKKSRAETVTEWTSACFIVFILLETPFLWKFHKLMSYWDVFTIENELVLFSWFYFSDKITWYLMLVILGYFITDGGIMVLNIAEHWCNTWLYNVTVSRVLDITFCMLCISVGRSLPSVVFACWQLYFCCAFAR